MYLRTGAGRTGGFFFDTHRARAYAFLHSARRVLFTMEGKVVKLMRTPLMLVMGLTITVMSEAENVHTWTSVSGKTIDAEFISYDGQRVTLRSPKGKQIAIDFGGLSPADQQYVQRLGIAKQDSESKAATLTETVPQKIRLVEGVAYDFTPVDQALLVARNRVEEASKLMDAEGDPLRAEEIILTAKLKCFDDVAAITQYRIMGTVIQVLSDGLLVNSPEGNLDGYDGLVFVKGYSKQNTIVDGTDVNLNGICTGRYQYISTMGSTKTIPKFISGKTVSPDEWEGEVLPLP